MNIQHIDTNLSPSDMQNFLKSLAQWNQESFIPVGPEAIRKVQRMPNNDFNCQIVTGDTITVPSIHMVAPSFRNNVTAVSPINSVSAVSKEEGQQAIQQVKAQKYLSEKGLSVRGMTGEEIIEAAELVRVINNENQHISPVLSKEEVELINELTECFSSENSSTVGNDEDKQLINDFKQFFHK